MATECEVVTARAGPLVPEMDCFSPCEAEFLYKQIFDASDYTQYGIAIHKGDVIMDVGCNIGMFGVYALLQTSGEVTLYSFEPVPAVAELCKRNLHRHEKQAPRTTHVFPVGLTSPEKVGSATFDFYPGYSLLSSCYDWNSDEREKIGLELVKNGSNMQACLDSVEKTMKAVAVKVELKTLSQIIDQEGIARIDLLKIDVEKAEWDVLMGIRQDHWARINQIVIETHLIGNRVQEVERLLRVHGFDHIHIGKSTVPSFLAYKMFGTVCAPGDGVESKEGLVCNLYASRSFRQR